MEFLSDEWITAMDRAAHDLEIETEAAIVIEHVVRDVPGRGEVRYHVVLARGNGLVAIGPAEAFDVRFTTEYPTAVALARGETNAQEALARGGIRLGGDVNALVARSVALSALGDAFAAVREQTEYPPG